MTLALIPVGNSCMLDRDRGVLARRSLHHMAGSNSLKSVTLNSVGGGGRRFGQQDFNCQAETMAGS